MESLGQVLPKAKLSYTNHSQLKCLNLAKLPLAILNWTYSINIHYIRPQQASCRDWFATVLGPFYFHKQHKLVGLDSSTEVFDCWRLTNRYSTISVLPCLATRWRNDSEDTEKFGCICVLRRLRSALNNKKKKVRRPR